MTPSNPEFDEQMKLAKRSCSAIVTSCMRLRNDSVEAAAASCNLSGAGSQLAEHGGLAGIRDKNALESALARPQQQANYGDADVAALAAAYALGLARTRSFHDGNKRVAWLAANIFLGLNGYTIEFDPMEAVRTMESTAEGITGGDDLASWFRDRLVKKTGTK